MRRTPFTLVAALALATLTPSCRLFHRSPKQVPFAPPPPVQPAQTKPQVVEMPPQPDIPPQGPDLSQQAPQTPSEPLPPAPRRHRPPHARESAEAAPAAAVPEQPPAAIPELEQILTPQRRQAYNEEIERDIAAAQKTVDALQGRRLSGDQTAYLLRVRAFIEQANQARTTDLIRARNLAERASVLAEDLRRSVQ
jgi:hypothetical protein